MIEVNCLTLFNETSATYTSFRKVIYCHEIVLTSRAVYESVSSVLESLRNSDFDSARRKLEAIEGEGKTERERGSILAAAGILHSMTKTKEGNQQWDPERISRAAVSIRGNQMADEFDAGYAETLANYVKLLQQTPEVT